jgi:DNA-binding IclR family transcriptional regulator
VTRSDLARLDLPAAALRAALVCLDLADEAGGEPFAVSAGMIADRSGLPHTSARRGLSALLSLGLLVEIDAPAGPKPGVYRLVFEPQAVAC